MSNVTMEFLTVEIAAVASKMLAKFGGKKM
jgi:hypothetical protein